MNFKEIIQQAVKPMFKRQTFRAKVINVDKQNDTCEVEPVRGGAKYFDVKLKSFVGDTKSKFILYPSLGSVVTVSLIANNTSDVFISQYSEFESVEIINQKMSIVLSENGQIKFNDGSFGGLVKINELKTQIDKNTQAIKTMQQVLKSWTPIAQDGGASLKTISSGFISMPLANLANIENKGITHG